jgi:hypothetical protein
MVPEVKNQGARSVATVHRSEKDSAAMTARIRRSPAAYCSATAGPSDEPIRITGPSGAVAPP